MKESIDITIKPTMACNMKCKHCFNGDFFNHSDMLDVDQACIFMEKACQEYKKVKVIFHGGEPTLAGIEFYNYFYKKQKEFTIKYGTDFSNVITTNGLLLTDSFIDLLNNNNVQINISFDGPFNSVLRQETSKVQNTVFRIRDKGGKYRCFCTLSNESVPYLVEIYQWFKRNHLNFKTLPVEKRGYANKNNIIMSPEELATQFEKVYRIWITDQECDISYSTLESFTSLRRDAPYKSFWFGRKISLNADGMIYPFGRPNDINFCLGKPSEIKNLSDCFETQNYKQCLAILKRIREKRCPFCFSKVTCGGVNINIAYLYVDEQELIDYSCYQASLIDKYILKVNDEIIDNFKKGNYTQYNKYVQTAFEEYKTSI